MSLKSILARIAYPIEGLVARIVPQSVPTNPVLTPYRGYASPDALHLQGRVLSPVARTQPSVDHAIWRNVRQMVRLFMTDEVTDVRIVAQGQEARSDEEGYVRLTLPRGGLGPGWHEVEATLPDHEGITARLPVRVPSAQAPFGVISDIDDTVLETGAYTLWRNLWTTFTGNAATRKVFPDAVRFFDRVANHDAPAFFVSSSPWNLYGFLSDVFARTGLPQAPMFLRDYGVSETQFITGTHGDHKGGAIDTILAANPDLSFVLVGDTGQHDAHVYHDAVHRHPGRITMVVLREPGPGPDAKSKAKIAAIRDAGVPVHSGESFDGVQLDECIIGAAPQTPMAVRA